MKTTLSLLVVLTFSSSLASGVEPGKADRGRQLMFIVRVLEGDPLGSRENGSIKVLTEPTIVTRENRPFTMMVGQEVPLNDSEGQIQFVETGLKLDGKPGTVKGDRLFLDITLTETRLDDSVKQSETRQQFTTEGTRVLSSIKLGEVGRYRIGKSKSGDGRERWAEIRAEVVEPLQAE